MTEIKKTLENPPSRLAKKIISLSVSNYWEEARKEWKMVYYYYVQTHHSCLCSPRGVHNITIIENIHNFNQMEVCNSCAILYLEINDCFKIESITRRLKKNINLNMDETCLNYLFNNKFIDELERKNYNLVKLSRKDKYCSIYRQEINYRIINVTDYANKPFFDMLNALILWSKKQGKLESVSIFIEDRKKLASIGQVNSTLLTELFMNNEIELLQNVDKSSVLEIIGKEINTTLDLKKYISSSKRKIRREKIKSNTFSKYDGEEVDPTPYTFNIKPKKEKKKEEESLEHEKNKQKPRYVMPTYLFKNSTIPQEIRNTCKLKPENLDFIYTYGAPESDWYCFAEYINFPITSDNDMLELASLIFNWFTKVTSSTLFCNFFQENDQMWMRFQLKHVPFHKDFTEVDYICSFLKLLRIDPFCFIINSLCYATESEDEKEMWIAKINQILSRSSYKLVLGPEYDYKMIFFGTLYEKVQKTANPELEKGCNYLTPLQLRNDSDLSEKKSYRYELFGNTYLHFTNDKKYYRKFSSLDGMFKDGHFPLDRKALLIVAYFMFLWSVEVAKTESYYYIVKYFEDKSFDMTYYSISSLFIPLPKERQWINMFWLLLPCKKNYIEILLGNLLLSMPIDIRQDKIKKLNAMLEQEKYEAKCLNKKTYIELVKVQ